MGMEGREGAASAVRVMLPLQRPPEPLSGGSPTPSPDPAVKIVASVNCRH